MATPEFPLVSKILNGGIAGIVGVSIVYPIDLVKTRLQNQNTTSGQKMYSSMFDCFVKTYRNEGYFGMYRGSAVNILLVTPEKAIKLTANDIFRFLFLDKQGKLTVTKEMAAGGLAGLCQTVVTTPMELLKIQMQLDAQRNSGVKTSAWKLAMGLVSSQGIRGLYRGCLSTVLRDVNFSIIYFPLFAHLKSLGKSASLTDEVTCQAPFYWSFVSGCGAGGFAAVAVNPIDVVKTRLQAQGQLEKGATATKPISGATNVISPTAPESRDVLLRSQSSYNGVTDAFIRVYKEEGWRAFFKGAACRVLVIAPLFGIAQTVYYLGVGEYILNSL